MNVAPIEKGRSPERTRNANLRCRANTARRHRDPRNCRRQLNFAEILSRRRLTCPGNAREMLKWSTISADRGNEILARAKPAPRVLTLSNPSRRWVSVFLLLERCHPKSAPSSGLTATFSPVNGGEGNFLTLLVCHGHNQCQLFWLLRVWLDKLNRQSNRPQRLRVSEAFPD